MNPTQAISTSLGNQCTLLINCTNYHIWKDRMGVSLERQAVARNPKYDGYTDTRCGSNENDDSIDSEDDNDILNIAEPTATD